MPISQDQITTLDQLEEKLTLALTDLLLLRDSNNEDYKVKASTILQAAVDKAGAELIGGNVESGNTKAVTGAEVANIISSLPNDSVLHYSFDEIPDIPDGTADEVALNGNTYGVVFNGNGTITTDAYVDGDNLIHKSNVNGNVNFKSDVSTTIARGVYKLLIGYRGKIVIFDIQTKTNNIQVRVEYREAEGDTTKYLYPLGENPLTIGKHRIILLVPDYYSYNLTFYAQNTTDYNYTEWELLNFYAGDGSYVTPIIDNVNGQNNATNNGGIAVQGVSGKGAYFPSSLQSVTVNELPAVTSNDSFSINLWLNISEMYVPDTNTAKAVFAIGSFNGLIGICRQGNYINFIARADTGTIGQTTPMDKGHWHCYSMVYDGQIHTFNYYIDGVKQVNTSSITNPAGYQFGNNDKWTIWGDYVRQGIGADSIQQPAEMDDVLFFDRALTDIEVMALYLNKANTPKYYNRADWKLEQIEAEVAEEE